MTSELTPDRIVELLELTPHPEGGRYRQMWEGPSRSGRSVGTAIYFLLAGGDVSHWHRVDATEVWHHYAGAPIELSTYDGGPDAAHHDEATDGEAVDATSDLTSDTRVDRRVLGVDLARGERPQLVVPAGSWQSARSLGAWTLVGCTVSPGFEFTGFELAPPGWSPSPSTGV
ncbi:MAG: cupin domain-containing protein [Ilumatobacter sp.]|uniref:cupin domain-containing protein n=1 Tax=Ilumatobacter sp. TaxID=1967498 RepID=UPI00391B88D7